MSADDWKEVERLFSVCLEQPEMTRLQWLGRCEVASEIKREVERLLRHHDSAGSFLENPPAAVRAIHAATPARLEPGVRLAERFEIIGYLGQGGMGEVYSALDAELGEPVAVKILNPALLATADAMLRFRRELQMARRVTHPNVCRLYDLGRDQRQDGDLCFLTMELVEGETLAKRLEREGRLTPGETDGIVTQLLQGLAAAHRAGVIHRDLKPSNIMLASGRVVIMDFGLARRESSEASITDSGQVVGTILYMAPEQLQGKALTERTDLYAMGLLMYEMLTGQRPFGGDPITASVRRLSNAVSFPRSAVPEVSAARAALIDSCLHADPEMRPDSAAELEMCWREEAPPVRRRRRPQIMPRRTWLAAAGAGSALAAGWYWGIRPFGGTSIDEKRVGGQIFVAPTGNASGDPALDGLADLLRLLLAQSAWVAVVEQPSLARVMKQMGKDPDVPWSPEAVREAAWRLGIPLTAFSTLTSLAGGYALTVKLEKRGGEPQVPRHHATRTFDARDKAALFGAAREAVAWVRQEAGESTAAISESNRLPEDVTTPSWEALSFFAKAERYGTTNRLEEAVLSLDAALDRDPEFTLAAMRKGDLLMALRRPLAAFGTWKNALGLLEKRRVTRREELRIRGMFLADTGAWREADRYFAQWALEFPEDWRGWFYRSVPLLLQERPAELLRCLEQVHRLYPGYAAAYIYECWAHCANRDFPAAKEAVRQMVTRGERERAEVQQGVVEFVAGNMENALAAFDRLRAHPDPVWATRGSFHAALLRFELGRVQEIPLLVQRALTQPFVASVTAERALLHACSAWALSEGGRFNEAMDHIQSSLGLDAGPNVMRQAVLLLVRQGNVQQARQVASVDSSLAKLAVFQEVANQLSGSIGSRARSFDQAARAFGAIDADAPLSLVAHTGFVEAFAAAGEKDKAKRLLVKLVDHPWLGWVQAGSRPPGTWYRAQQMKIEEK